MKQTIRPQFILLYHCDTPTPGTPGCMINWIQGGIFDNKDDAVKWLLTNGNRKIKGHTTVRVNLPTAFVESPKDLVPITGAITDLAEDEPEDRCYPEVYEEKIDGTP